MYRYFIFNSIINEIYASNNNDEYDTYFLCYEAVSDLDYE